MKNHSFQKLYAVGARGKRLFSSSLFVQTWLILLVLFLSVTGLFVITMNRVENTHRRQIACQTNLELLTGASEIAELGLSNTRADLGTVIWNTDVTGYFVDPRREDAQRQYRIIQAFSRIRRSNGWIRSMWLASLLSGEVLTMDGETAELTDFPDGEILSLYTREPVPSRPDSPASNAELILSGERMFWLEPFVTDRPIAWLCVEIDMDVLCAGIAGESAEEIGLYDREGRRLSPSGARLPRQAVLSESGLYVETPDQDPGRASFYRVENASLPLVFLKGIDRSAFEVPVSATLAGALPILPVLAAAVLLLTWFLAAGIYRPINYLVRRVLSQAADRESDATARNELDYVELSYFRTLRQNETMRGTLEHFSRDMQEQVLRKLLQGKTPEEAGTAYLGEEILQNWRDGRKMCVAACRRKGSWNVTDPVLDSQLFHVTVAGALEAPEGPVCRVVSMGACLEAVLLSADEKEPEEAVLRQLRELEEQLRDVLRPSECEIITGEGGIVTELEGLADSWEEALRGVDYHVYLEGEANAREAEKDAENASARAQYLEQWDDILKLVIAGNEKKAESAVDEYLSAFWKDPHTPEETAAFCRESLSALTERLLTGHNIRISPPDAAAEGQLSSMPPAEQKIWLRLQLDSVRREVEAFLQRKGSRYVSDAMNYVRDHYDNRDLSVHDVADHLGISGNYFSTLFRETTGSSFVAYLNRVRVEQAGYLLKETRIPIGDVGFRCGFNTVQNFNRTFKKIMGMPPSQYRSGDQ